MRKVFFFFFEFIIMLSTFIRLPFSVPKKRIKMWQIGRNQQLKTCYHYLFYVFAMQFSIAVANVTITILMNDPDQGIAESHRSIERILITADKVTFRTPINFWITQTRAHSTLQNRKINHLYLIESHTTKLICNKLRYWIKVYINNFNLII